MRSALPSALYRTSGPPPMPNLPHRIEEAGAEQERAAEIARGLSKAQWRWLCEAVSDPYDGLYTYPPANTHRVLNVRGLTLYSGRLTDLGLAVLDHLRN